VEGLRGEFGRSKRIGTRPSIRILVEKKKTPAYSKTIRMKRERKAW